MLDFLLLLIAIIAAGIGSALATLLAFRFVRALNDVERLDAWLDRVIDRHADYMEDHAHGLDVYPVNDWHEWLSVRRYLVTRWLHGREHSLAWAVFRLHHRMFPKPCLHEQVEQDKHLWDDRT